MSRMNGKKTYIHLLYSDLGPFQFKMYLNDIKDVGSYQVPGRYLENGERTFLFLSLYYNEVIHELCK